MFTIMLCWTPFFVLSMNTDSMSKKQLSDLEIANRLRAAGVGSAAYMFRNEDYRQLVGDTESDRLGIMRSPYMTPE